MHNSFTHFRLSDAQILDGCNAFPDADTGAGEYRDEPSCSCLQHEARHQTAGNRRINQCDQGVCPLFAYRSDSVFQESNWRTSIERIANIARITNSIRPQRTRQGYLRNQSAFLQSLGQKQPFDTGRRHTEGGLDVASSPPSSKSN